MKNKEKFKRAFSALHTSENFRIRLENLIKHEKIKAYCISSESSPIEKWKTKKIKLKDYHQNDFFNIPLCEYRESAE